MRHLYAIIFSALALSLLSCADNTGPASRDAEDPAIDGKAMLMDVYLTDAARPSFEYYGRIRRDMREIHRKYDGEYSHILAIPFRFPFVPYQLIIRFDEATTALIDAGEYHAWDGLNAEFGMSDFYKTWHAYMLEFECCSHLYYVANLYRELPGIVYVDKNWTSAVRSNIYPRAVGDTMSYFYEKGGSCSFDGCEYVEYLYIRTIGRHVELIGYRHSRTAGAKPQWWTEAFSHYLDWYDHFFERE